MPKGKRPPSEDDDQEGSERERKAPRPVGKRPASAPLARRVKRSISAPPSQDAPARRPRRTKQAAPVPTRPGVT